LQRRSIAFFRVGLYGLRSPKKREIPIFGAARGDISEDRALLSGVIGCMRAKDCLDGKLELLRIDPKIGSELEVHPHAAGGITDLSFRKIRIELKASGEDYLTLEKSFGFSNQATQYVVGSDRRFGILCVLDHSPKRVPPGAVANDIALRPMWPPENDGAGNPILLGVVIVRGNLARPSDLSR